MNFYNLFFLLFLETLRNVGLPPFLDRSADH